MYSKMLLYATLICTSVTLMCLHQSKLSTFDWSGIIEHRCHKGY